MSLTAAQVFRDSVTAGVPSSGEHEPEKAEIRSWGRMIEGTANSSTIVKATLAQLQAVTPSAETNGGIVLADPTASNNGLYYRDAGAWVKGRGFPDTFAAITLAGTANAQTGTVGSGVNPADIEVYYAVVTTANSGPMTLSISGETARDVVNAAGNALSAGEWTGVVLFFLNDDGDYQLIIDAGAAAAAAQSATDAAASAVLSEQSHQDAEDDADRAQSYAAMLSADKIKFATVALLLADEVMSYTAGPGLIEVGAGDIIEAQGFRYEVAASAAVDEHVTTAGGVKLYVLPSDDGRYNILAFGTPLWPDDAHSVLLNVIGTGLPLKIPAEHFGISDKINVTTNSVSIVADKGAVLEHTGISLAHFYVALPGGSFHLSGLHLLGNVLSNTVPDQYNRGAITIINTPDFSIEGNTFEQCIGSGISVSLLSSGTISSGSVRKNKFIKGDMSNAPDPWGIQDNAPIQVYHYSRNIVFSDNVVEGKWYCGFFGQDWYSTGLSKISGLQIERNRFSDLSQYGIVLYTIPTLAIASFADNGSGEFRVTTTTPHYFDDGELLNLRLCGDATGLWKISVVSETEFDLIGSTYTAGGDTSGQVRISENCSAVINDNVVDGVDGDREPYPEIPGNRPFGAGLYLQGVGGVFARDNLFYRTNLYTNSETLTPGSIGLNAPSGRTVIKGGGVFDSGYHGMSLKLGASNQGPNEADIYVGGLIVANPTRNLISAHAPRFLTLDDITLVADTAGNGRVFVESISGVPSEHVAISDIRCFEFNNKTASIFMEINGITDFHVSRVVWKNDRPASQLVEGIRLLSCNTGSIRGCDIDGGLSPMPALNINGSTNVTVSESRFRMTSDANARSTVSMINTCTGSVFERSNDTGSGRMENLSTGGRMHTKSSDTTSGGKTRQIGDTIENTGYADTEAWLWVKRAVSSGGSDWRSITPA